MRRAVLEEASLLLKLADRAIPYANAPLVEAAAALGVASSPGMLVGHGTSLARASVLRVPPDALGPNSQHVGCHRCRVSVPCGDRSATRMEHVRASSWISW